jgi:ABC-type transporter Mla subunit MlaD
VIIMTKQKIPGPREIKAAAQAAAETAQTMAGDAMRIPPATVQLAGQLPVLLENMATATARLNEAIDRAERYMALADPMLRTMDRMLPQLETLVATGDDAFKTLSSLPGVSSLGRFTGGSSSSTRKRATPKRTQPPSK